MGHARILIAALVAALLSGCDWPLAPPRYQLTTTTDGKIYRLDTKTGAVHYITPDRMISLSDEIPMLRIGEHYQMSDAKDDTKFLKYIGSGQFEKSQWAVQKKP